MRIPKSIKESIEIDKENGDTLWQDSTQMEMKNDTSNDSSTKRGVDLQCADVQNAFHTAPAIEKYYMVAGPEFGDEEGKVFIVRKALCRSWHLDESSC